MIRTEMIIQLIRNGMLQSEYLSYLFLPILIRDRLNGVVAIFSAAQGFMGYIQHDLGVFLLTPRSTHTNSASQ